MVPFRKHESGPIFDMQEQQATTDQLDDLKRRIKLPKALPRRIAVRSLAK